MATFLIGYLEGIMNSIAPRHSTWGLPRQFSFNRGNFFPSTERDLSRTLSFIQDGSLSGNCSRVSVVNFFGKKLHFRCLTALRILFWKQSLPYLKNHPAFFIQHFYWILYLQIVDLVGYATLATGGLNRLDRVKTIF